MSDHLEYSHADLKIVTLREAVALRPAMYFGDNPAADWPLVFGAWTATDVLDYAVEPTRQVDVTLHRDGDLSAAVAGARLVWPARAQLRPIEELVLGRMWWRQLARSTTLTVRQRGTKPGAGQQVGDQQVWNDLDITVRMTLDPELIGVPAEHWWHDGPDRLRTMLATDRFRPTSPYRLTITDEATAIIHIP